MASGGIGGAKNTQATGGKGEQPYLSIVVTSRNDDHGGDMLGRMNAFIDGLVSQCKRYRLPAELLIVEWNPPHGRPLLRDALKWPTDLGPCQVRFVTVPPEVHGRLKYSSQLPLFQMIAKNVGIRRAKGRFVLATNIDIIFSNALMRYIAARRLQPGRLYRVDRFDVKSDVPIDASQRDRLAYCEARENLLRICQRGGTKNAVTGTTDIIFPHHAELWAKARLAKAFPKLGKRWFDMTPEHAAWFYEFHRSIGRLHTNACGDFTLMASEDWADVHGYAEWEMYSFHIDSLLCHAAVASGKKEVFLGGAKRIYHIEHSVGSGFTPEAQQKLWNRLEDAKIERLSDEQLWNTVKSMRAGTASTLLAGAGWGLATLELPESRLDGGEDEETRLARNPVAAIG